MQFFIFRCRSNSEEEEEEEEERGGVSRPSSVRSTIENRVRDLSIESQEIKGGI